MAAELSRVYPLEEVERLPRRRSVMRSVELREVVGERSVVRIVGAALRLPSEELVREGETEGVVVRIVGAVDPVKTLERELVRLVALGVVMRGVVTLGVEGGE